MGTLYFCINCDFLLIIKWDQRNSKTECKLMSKAETADELAPNRSIIFFSKSGSAHTRVSDVLEPERRSPDWECEECDLGRESSSDTPFSRDKFSESLPKLLWREFWECRVLISPAKFHRRIWIRLRLWERRVVLQHELSDGGGDYVNVEWLHGPCCQRKCDDTNSFSMTRSERDVRRGRDDSSGSRSSPKENESFLKLIFIC